MQLLFNHTSPETAYHVADYPYGFTLRCQIRYWLEYKPNKGFRFMSQTTNPKRAGTVWNKPKASTYCRFGGAMFLNEIDHVQWSGLHEYCDTAETVAWAEKFSTAVPETGKALLAKWVAAKVAYEIRKAEAA